VLKDYIKALFETGKHGDAREESCRVVTALAKTLEIQQKIDELYPQVEKDVVSISS
jgi:hypothetical protein